MSELYYPSRLTEDQIELASRIMGLKIASNVGLLHTLILFLS